MTAPETSPRRARWHAGIEVAAAGAVLALAPREAPGTPGVWMLGGLLMVGSLGLWLRGAGWADVGLVGVAGFGGVGGAGRRGGPGGHVEVGGVGEDDGPGEHGGPSGHGARQAAEPRTGQHVLLGLALGALAALVASFLVGPGLGALTGRKVETAALAAVEGNAAVLLQALLLAWVHALGVEMVFRGWLLDRLEAVWPDSARPGRDAPGPLVLAGLAYGWYLGDGSAASIAGGTLLGVGLGLLCRAGRPSLALAIATHGAFASAHLVLVYAGALGG